MEGTRRGGESARKIFERGARSGQRKARLREECKMNSTENESGKESGKVSRQNGWKRKMQDTDGILERKKKNTEKKERGEVVPEEWVRQ
jgi:hypothetical protein